MDVITRDSKDKIICGLCGSIARSMKIDPILVRLGVVFLTLSTGLIPGLVTYLIGWIITPTAESKSPFERVVDRNQPSGDSGVKSGSDSQSESDSESDPESDS